MRRLLGKVSYPLRAQTVAPIEVFAGFTGLAIANNGVDATNDIDIAVGACVSNDAAIADRVLMSLTSALTKQLDAAWAVGTNAGMRDTGVIANAWWHIFLIKRTDTGVVDVLASQSFSSPTMPTNYDKRKWIGAIRRNAGAIETFNQHHDEFLRNAVELDVNQVSSVGTSAVTRTLTVPTGLKVWAMCRHALRVTGNAADFVVISSLDVSDEVASVSNATVGAREQAAANITYGAASVTVRTNTSGQVRERHSDGDANSVFSLTTIGWSVNRAEV